MINKKNFKKRKLLYLFSIFLISIIAISTISIVTAADITIDSNSSGGLKEAVKIANNGDTISLKNGNYIGANNTKIIINKSITIKGLGSNVVLDGEGKNYIFNISGDKVLLTKLKITKAYSTFHGGAIYHKSGSLTLNNCTFTYNKANRYGGVINSEKKASLAVNSCIFTNNQGEYGGGAISTLGKLTVNKCIFTNNQGAGGGAISSWGLTITNSNFTNNKASYDGGAIGTFSKSTVTNCIFKNNQAKEDGGAIYSNSGSLISSKSSFTNNKANDGGAIYTFTKTTLNKCSFTNNYAINKDGGAIDFMQGSSTVNTCTFKNNQAKRNGGAISIGINTANTAKIKITNSQFTKNIAGKKYNAIYAYKGSSFTRKNVKITPEHGTIVKK